MKLLVLTLLLLCELATAHQRMTVTFRYRGETLFATFYSNVLGGQLDDFEELRFLHWTQRLDQFRIQNYLGIATAADGPKYMNGFFSKEKLFLHDEILVVHRSPLPGPKDIEGDPEVIGLFALDRLGHPFYDCIPGWNEPQFEHFLLEKRLAPLGLRVERPKPVLWEGDKLPAGVFRHWEPYVAQRYFDAGRVYIGDVVQANALVSHEGVWPLVHSLANFYGLLSTGRLVPGRKSKTVEGLTVDGPAVIIPTLFVWEVFNTFKKGVRRQGSRTRYYQRAGAKPQCIGGNCEWTDPWLGKETLVQIFSKTGDEFRLSWPRLFAREERFSFVRDVQILHTEYWRNENWDGKTYFTKQPGEAPIGHHPTNFEPCVRALLGD